MSQKLWWAIGWASEEWTTHCETKGINGKWCIANGPHMCKAHVNKWWWQPWERTACLAPAPCSKQSGKKKHLSIWRKSRDLSVQQEAGGQKNGGTSCSNASAKAKSGNGKFLWLPGRNPVELEFLAKAALQILVKYFLDLGLCKLLA